MPDSLSTKVKICGITSVDDAMMSADLGADMIGLNFYPGSHRFVTPMAAAAISKRVSVNVLSVGVFVNCSVDSICKISETARLGAIQLHGDEDDQFIEELRSKSDLRIIKAVRMQIGENGIRRVPRGVDHILLDSHSDKGYGGTGQVFNWKSADSFGGTEFFLAGGLNPENVVDAITALRPFAVDVASGVESFPGKKDPEKLKLFINRARQA